MDSKIFFKLNAKFDSPTIESRNKKIILFVMTVIVKFCKKNNTMGFLKRLFVSKDNEICYFVFKLYETHLDGFKIFFNDRAESIPEPDQIDYIKIYDEKSSFNLPYFKK